MSVYRSRIQKIKRAFEKKRAACALLISSAPFTFRTRDQHHLYRQNSDFYYLTGIAQEGFTLLISSKLKHPLLLSRRPDRQRIVWDGPPPVTASLAEAIGAEPMVVLDVQKELIKLLKGIQRLYYQNVSGTISWNVAQKLVELPAHERASWPSAFHHLDEIIEPMRLIKDSHEVKLIEQAAGVTIKALREVVPLIRPDIKEAYLAHAIDRAFERHNGRPGFETIVASGRSAAVLHYRERARVLKRGELLLIDCGVERQLYNADITRVFPVDGKFNNWQAELYRTVRAAHKAAISKVRPGATIQAVYDAAARELTRGLKDLRVLRGQVAQLFKRDAYKPYFPHGIGHSLGLDVHDVGRLRGATKSDPAIRLKEGMVITIEPGLYFPRRTGRLPACGVRLEDDVLVTKSGCRVLTKDFPIELNEIEALLKS